MANFMTYALLVPIVAVVIGFFAPHLVIPASKKPATRWRVVKIWGGLWILGIFIAAGLSDPEGGEEPSESPEMAVSPESRQLIVDTLRGPWLPREDPNGFGAELQVVADITEDEVVELGRQIAGQHSGPLAVTFYRSRESWEHYEAFNTDPAHQWDPQLTQDLIFGVMRGMGRQVGAVGRWLASEGDMGHLAGVEVVFE